MADSPTFGSGFAGFGGIDLGLERAGWKCRWQIEKDEYCRQVLAKHWPGVYRWPDVRTFPAAWSGTVDMIAAGFPCQDLSVAGKREGIRGERSGLFFDLMRIIRVVRPRLLLLENVPGLLSADNGGAMGAVLGELAESGYDAEWDCIPAAAFGAPHLRYRVFVVAYAQCCGRVDSQPRDGEHPAPRKPGRINPKYERIPGEAGGEPVDVAAAQRFGCSGDDRRGPDAEPSGRREEESVCDGSSAGSRATSGDRGGEVCTRTSKSNTGRAGVAERHREDLSDTAGSGLEIGNGVFGRGSRPHPTVASREWWATEPDVGRVADGVPARVDRLRGLGNAVVPYKTEWLGRRIRRVYGI